MSFISFKDVSQNKISKNIMKTILKNSLFGIMTCVSLAHIGNVNAMSLSMIPQSRVLQNRRLQNRVTMPASNYTAQKPTTIRTTTPTYNTPAPQISEPAPTTPDTSITPIEKIHMDFTGPYSGVKNYITGSYQFVSGIIGKLIENIRPTIQGLTEAITNGENPITKTLQDITLTLNTSNKVALSNIISLDCLINCFNNDTLERLNEYKLGNTDMIIPTNVTNYLPNVKEMKFSEILDFSKKLLIQSFFEKGPEGRQLNNNWFDAYAESFGLTLLDVLKEFIINGNKVIISDGTQLPAKCIEASGKFLKLIDNITLENGTDPFLLDNSANIYAITKYNSRKEIELGDLSKYKGDTRYAIVKILSENYPKIKECLENKELSIEYLLNDKLKDKVLDEIRPYIPTSFSNDYAYNTLAKQFLDTTKFQQYKNDARRLLTNGDEIKLLESTYEAREAARLAEETKIASIKTEVVKELTEEEQFLQRINNGIDDFSINIQDNLKYIEQFYSLISDYNSNNKIQSDIIDAFKNYSSNIIKASLGEEINIKTQLENFLNILRENNITNIYTKNTGNIFVKEVISSNITFISDNLDDFKEIYKLNKEAENLHFKNSSQRNKNEDWKNMCQNLLSTTKEILNKLSKRNDETNIFLPINESIKEYIISSEYPQQDQSTELKSTFNRNSDNAKEAYNYLSKNDIDPFIKVGINIDTYIRTFLDNF